MHMSTNTSSLQLVNKGGGNLYRLITSFYYVLITGWD